MRFISEMIEKKRRAVISQPDIEAAVEPVSPIRHADISQPLHDHAPDEDVDFVAQIEGTEPEPEPEPEQAEPILSFSEPEDEFDQLANDATLEPTDPLEDEVPAPTADIAESFAKDAPFAFQSRRPFPLEQEDPLAQVDSEEIDEDDLGDVAEDDHQLDAERSIERIIQELDQRERTEAPQGAFASVETLNGQAERLDASDLERNLDLAFEMPLKAFGQNASQEPEPEALAEGATAADIVEPFGEQADVDPFEEPYVLEERVEDAAQPALSETPAVEPARAKRIWDIDPVTPETPDVPSPSPARAYEAPLDPPDVPVTANRSLPDANVPTPAEPDDDVAPIRPSGHRAGRVKTRLLGFHRPDEVDSNPFGGPRVEAPNAGAAAFPVGWLVVESGPGRGSSYALFDGVATIGRGNDQTVPLDHGDTSISRDNHAAVAFDPEQNSFYVGHGGKANLVRLNGMPVLSTEVLSNGDQIRIGETTLRFVALCGPDFSWTDDQTLGARDVAAN